MTTDRPAQILVVEDQPSMAQLARAYLLRRGHRVEIVGTGGEALAILRERPPEIVVLDLNLPDLDGKAILAEARLLDLPTAVIVVTADGSLSTAVEAMRAGAYDFIVKPFSADRLNATVANALERVRLRGEVATLRETFVRDRFCGFVGASLPMQAVYRAIEAAAPSNATVFLTGESGTGKEVAAEAIHQRSRRAGKPFIAINCGAIPKDLIESELFGHVKGSFTGALNDRQGAAKTADGGTLFLDEIGEMQFDLQSKLLRFLQTRRFRPVGGTREEEVDVRIVCATNRDPLAEVQAGRFREDLYYRLHVIPIHLPPLAQREDDLALIAEHLLDRYAKEEGRRFARLATDARAAMLAYDWPGNVRQLQNVLRNAVVMHDGEELTAEMLPIPATGSARPPIPTATAPAPVATPAQAAAASSATDPGTWAGEPSIVALERVERAAIQKAIELCGGNIPRAAAFLQVSASTIYRKKQAWGA